MVGQCSLPPFSPFEKNEIITLIILFLFAVEVLPNLYSAVLDLLHNVNCYVSILLCRI